MASTRNRDPRLNSTGKRLASRSPGGNVSSSSANKRPTGPSRQSSSHRSGDAPHMAVMSPARASETPASMIVVEDFFKATTTAAELGIELRAAQMEYAKADREFRNMQDKFEQFPAIKEQKTQARNRAQSKLVNIEGQLNEQKPRQSQIFATLAGLLDMNSSDRSHASSEDAGSIMVHAGQGPSLQSSLDRLEPRVLALESRVNKSATEDSAIDSRLKALEDSTINEPATSKPTLKLLADLEMAVKKMPIDVSGRVKKLENAMMDAPSVTYALLGKRIDRLERSIPTSTTPPLSANITSRIQALENHTRKGTPVLEGAIGETLNTIETRLEEIAETSAADKDDVIKHVDDFLDATKEDLAALRREVNDLMATTKTRLTEDLSSLRTIISEATKRLNHNALALDNSMERLKMLEDSSLSEPLTSLQQTVSVLQERLQAVENAKGINQAGPSAVASTATPGTYVWPPVLPDNDDEGSRGPPINGLEPANGSPDTSTRMLAEIEMLKGVTKQHTRIINNLTTDDLVRQMVYQMSQMYPDASNYQQAASTLRSEFQMMQERLIAVSGTVNTTVASLSRLSQRMPNFEGDIGQEVTKLQTKYVDLLQRCKNHDTILNEGKEKLQKVDELAGDVRQLTAAAGTIPEYLKKVAELQVKVPEVEDAVRDVSTANGVDRNLPDGAH